MIEIILGIIVGTAVFTALQKLSKEDECGKELGDMTLRELHQICKGYQSCEECPIPRDQVCTEPPYNWNVSLDLDKPVPTFRKGQKEL